MNNPDHILSTGTIVDDRYRVTRLIAEGGMSVVYEVEDTRLGGTMALKEMRELMADRGERELMLNQFKREAEVLSQLAHLNLPRVTDYFICNGRRYLVQELIEGKTLEEVMDEESPRKEEEVVAWALQVCDALTYLHSQGMVYRDLKPSNVIVGPGGTLKLIDFGLVRFFSMGKPKDTVIMGTPGFAAPEQYGQGETDPRSDVFSLGVLIHHLLTGHDPTSTPFLFPDARVLNPAVSEDLEQVLFKALALDPAARFQSMEEMKRVIKGERVILAESESFSYRHSEPSLREYGISMGTSLVGGALGVFFYIQNPWFPWFSLLALTYAPFWAWLLRKDYLRKKRDGKLAVVVTEAGLHYRDAVQRFFVKWDEITSMQFVRDRFAQVKKAVVETAKGKLSFVVEGDKDTPAFLDMEPLEGADRLCQVVMKQSRLRLAQPGTELFLRR